MAACEGAVGKPGAPGAPGEPGQPGQPGQPGEPGGVPPRIDDPIPDLQLAASGEAATHTIDLNDHFFDPDGDEGEALTFAASSADDAVVTAAVSGSTLTLNAVAVGTAKITVRATDVDDLTSGADRFDVTVAVTVAPMVTPIPDTTLYQDEGPQTITLSEHFSHDNTITYRVVSALPAGHVTAEIAEGTLTLTPLARGQAIVVVEATADAKSVTDDFLVDVESGSTPPPPPPPPPVPTVAPTLTAEIDNMMLYLLDDAESIDLSEHFAHADEITYTATVRGASVDAEVSGSTLTVTPVLTGDSRVTVTATVGDKSIADSFLVRVMPGSEPPPPPPVPTVAPTKTAIPDQMLYQADGAQTIDLSMYFTHENAITYAVSSSPAGVVRTAVTAAGMLTLTPRVTGQTIVTVTATADGKSVSDEFTVDVMAGSRPAPPAPVAPTKTAIPDQTLYQADGAQTIDLSMYFTHENAITYAVSSSPSGVVRTAVTAAGMLTLTPRARGQTIVTVTATADGQSVSDDFTVDVMTGSEPPPPPPEAIDEKGTISAVTVKVDETKTVNVADKFTFTEGVSYEVDESNDNATATVDASGMVSITGKKVGELSLTVTATDARDNEAMQTIAVTVTPAGAQHKPRTLTIDGVGMSEDISLDDGQSLESRDRTTVTVAEKSGTGNLWTVTGVKKGTAEVRIWNADRTLDRPPIQVTVGNTAPNKKSDPGLVVGVSNGTTAGGLHATVNDKGVFARTDGEVAAPTGSGDKNRLYHVADVNFAEYFDDADGFPGDIDRYMARSNEPDVEVVGKPSATGVALDVQRSIVSGFPLVIYVIDKDGEKSEEVTITVGAPASVIADVYEVSQDQGDGDLATAKVYLREDKTHTLTVKHWKTDTTADPPTPVHDGFRFVDVFRGELGAQYPGADALNDDLDLTTALVDGTTLNPSSPGDASATASTYYTVTKTGPVEITGGTATEARSFTFGTGTGETANQPTLKFRVTDTGPATVTFTYYVAVRTEGATDGAADAVFKWKKDSETLRLNIVPSS